MAKVAIASEGEWVSEHFGHCPEYTIFDLEGNAIGRKTVVPNPGHQPGFLPQYLGRFGVTHVIAGGMGPRAQQLFLEQGIRPILGVSGKVEDVIQAFAAGVLQPGESTCHQPEGHECGHHGGGRCSEHGH
ncbi:MAG: NifB/NifX family molybdenum-iron cluster-binding protein [Clostridia bacterium]|nr:NifB/NifX family molybdenum-iron cluster-binding protein [Clostridia bacterium]MDH7573819.1 NifB/NifX family molybdenum-iron cluster-binding protein [Clostridia bacterium]